MNGRLVSTRGTVSWVVLAALVLVSTATAQVAVMPDRDVLSGSQLVVWGNTTHPNGTNYMLDFGDGSPLIGPVAVTDQSYIAHTHTYTTALPAEDFTATLTVGTDSMSVTVRAINSSFLNAEQFLDLQINQAIEDGLRSQYVNQTNRAANFAGGQFASWSGTTNNSFTMSFTSLAVLAFENHGHKPGAGTIYSEVAQRGLNFIINQLRVVVLSPEPAPQGDPCAEIFSGANYGDPLGSGPNCTGLSDLGGTHGYSTAVDTLAIAGSGTPGAIATHGSGSGGFTIGMTYLEIVQRLVNTMAYAQNFEGGWRYAFNQDNDGSANGWNTLGLLDSQAFGATIPAFVVSQLGEATADLSFADGSMGYTALNAPNTAKAGIRLQALSLVGVDLNTAPVAGGPPPQTTVDYIDAGWKGRNEDLECGSTGVLAPFQLTADGNHFGCMYSMFNVFKGLKLYGLATMPSSSRADLDWHREYKDYLVQQQVSPTSIVGGGWGNLAFSCCSTDTNGETALALLVLSESATILPDNLTFDLDLQEVQFGDTAELTVSAQTTAGSPVPGVTIYFDTQAGSLNHPLSLSDTTDAAGDAVVSYSYDGSSGPGTDEWVASVGSVLSNSAFVEWVSLNSPPDTDGVFPSLSCLDKNSFGPFDMVPITIEGVTDPDGDALTILITAVTTDEPTQRNNGDPAPDAELPGPGLVSVRNQSFGGGRDFGGNGRVYEIHFTADDGTAAPVAGSVRVAIAHDQAPPDDPCGDAVDNGQDFDALGFSDGS